MSTGAGKISQAISLAVATLAAGIMPAPLERDPARDEILRKMAAVAGERGWGMDVLLQVAGPDADLLFPGGSAELVEAWFDLCDRDMLEAMWDTEEARLSQRVRQALLYRLPAEASVRAASRKGLSVLLAPCEGKALRRSMMRTVNAIWQAAQDDSSGLTYMTKRLSLGGIYASVLLYWLARGENEAALAAFVDRRLADVLRFGRIKARMGGLPFMARA
ncbi:MULTISPECIES: rpsU-divergently transcribed protein [Acetobacter]|uniref:RpsU-divergently transcribed protein n=2 Tax=Acetobacter TaxID=434 RepID=A0AAN1PH14_9PROT|nr:MULTISPECIES: rpsU-divergently transcribed protein [Acetobacter]ASL40613.1 rpsU-divergently transcribed protein [Acetobacter oryzifermentans]AXN00045.1 rpsU-divergently transcribed protein [Acetobacter pomorum]KAA8397276.1 rpsU-divergently transcribed protein [Acetobacter sp. DmW_125128]KAA8397466.1 rpsU-divergently transcribed protein [Acetobacter sp. DmW_125127]KAA8399043.1 rpsU-divergently transcribed protein [Acetobacter sp. DmW_125124]